MSEALTEAEAQKRFCPLMRDKCAGSACMMWSKIPDFVNRPVGIVPEGEGWEKHGLESGIGGLVTRTQTWSRWLGRCVFRGS